MNILAHIGRATLAMLAEIGRVSLFLKDALLQGLTPKIFMRQILEQMMRIGYFSLPVVGLTAFFTGGALALQRPGRDGRLGVGIPPGDDVARGPVGDGAPLVGRDEVG